MKFDEMTKEQLVEYIKNLNEEQNGKYGLVWDKEKEPEKIVTECHKFIPVLNELKSRQINNGGIDNVLIEGDNFHALSVLNYTHKEKIDVIYIDPPYNTGNKDFVYNDKFVDAEDGYKHSKWLNFMEKRLKLARNLLKDDGLIFMSIDDNEQAQLKLLSDKIFGEDNFIACIINQSANSVYGSKATNKNKTYIKVKDYLLVYRKQFNDINLQPLYTAARSYLHDSHDFVYENNIKISTTDWFKNNYSELFKKYNLKINKNTIQKLLDFDDDFRKEAIERLLDIQYRTVGTFDSDKLSKDEIERVTNGEIIEHEGQLLYAENENHTSIGTLRSLRESCQLLDGEMKKCEILGDVWNTSSGYQNINAEGGIKFKNGKKPIILIKNILKSINNPNAIVLDFFAGSGSTGHAVLDLNNEDGGNRRFILCTNNENNICEEVTYPRIKNVMVGYDNKIGLGGKLRYFQTDFVDNSNNRDQLYYDLTEKCIPMLCVKENSFETVKITKEYMIFKNDKNDKYTCVYFDIFGNLEKEFVEELKQIKQKKVIYKFSLGDYIDESIFEGIENYTIEPIPYKIVELYKKLVKLSKEEN